MSHCPFIYIDNEGLYYNNIIQNKYHGILSMDVSKDGNFIALATSTIKGTLLLKI
jgi:hypothetical protein